MKGLANYFIRSLDLTRVIYVYFTSILWEIVFLSTSILRLCYSPLSVNIHNITQIILLINLLYLGHLKSQMTFHLFVLLHSYYTYHHSYKKIVKTDCEKDLNLVENMKTKGCRHVNLFQKKLYFHQTTIIYNYEKTLYLHQELR